MIEFGTSRVILGVIGCSLIAGLASAQKLKVETQRIQPINEAITKVFERDPVKLARKR